MLPPLPRGTIHLPKIDVLAIANFFGTFFINLRPRRISRHVFCRVEFNTPFRSRGSPRMHSFSRDAKKCVARHEK